MNKPELAQGEHLMSTSELLEHIPVDPDAAPFAATFDTTKNAATQMIRADQMAHYRVQMTMFDMSVTKPVKFQVRVMRSGREAHLGTASTVYFCESAINGDDSGCKKELPYSRIVGTEPRVICPHCGKSWEREKLCTEWLYYLPLQKIAKVMENWFLRMDCDTDFYTLYYVKTVKELREIMQECKVSPDKYEEFLRENFRRDSVLPLYVILKALEDDQSLESVFRRYLQSV